MFRDMALLLPPEISESHWPVKGLSAVLDFIFSPKLSTEETQDLVGAIFPGPTFARETALESSTAATVLFSSLCRPGLK